MLKWSQAVLLAFHAMALLAAKGNESMSVDEMAEELEVSADHLAKVMQRLGKCGLVRSSRGPKGGYAIQAVPDQLSLLDIYECIEGEYEESSCMLRDKPCSGRQCTLGEMVGSINGMVSEYLSKTKLSDLIVDIKK